jgi:hypothetical protein
MPPSLMSSLLSIAASAATSRSNRLDHCYRTCDRPCGGSGWGWAYSAVGGTGSAVFGPAQLKGIAAAFQAVLKDLGLTDRKDPPRACWPSSRLSLRNAQVHRCLATSAC